MKANKILIFLVILFFVIFIFVCGVAVYQEIKLENNITSSEKKEMKEKEKIYKVYDINDDLVLKLISPVNIIPMLDDEELLSTLYGVKRNVNITDLNNEQKLYLSLRYYMYSNNINVDTCDDGTTHLVKIDDLRSSYVKDDGYLEKIVISDEYVRVGEYTYLNSEDGFDVCFSIFGFEGLLRVSHDFEVMSAYREDNKMYINAKIVRYENVPGKETNPDNFYYETYDSYSENALVIETFEESIYGSWFEPSLSKYATYEFVYEIDGDNYYLETVNKK